MARLVYKKMKVRRKPAKAKGKKLAYPDKHNFKFAGWPTYLTTGAASLPVGVGSVNISSTLTTPTKNLFSIGGAFIFSANSINTNNFSMVNKTFDRYRINKISIRVIPQFNISDTVGYGNLPVMKVVMDYDDNIAPGVGDVWARRGKIHRLDKPFVVSFKPKVANALASSSVFSGYSVMNAPWINMAYLSVPHFGVKFGIRDFYNNTTPNTQVVRFEIMYHLSVKEQLSVGATGLDYIQHLDASGNMVDLSGNLVSDGAWEVDAQTKPNV